MRAKLSEQMAATIKDAATKLTGREKRAFQARVAWDYLEGSARRAETVLGWGREAVAKGLEELRHLPEEASAAQERVETRGRRKLAINLDCGPQSASNRTQFIKRMVEFADRNNLEIELIYYPPYHSKYNPIERCWGILEMHRNGTLLDTVDKAQQRAKTMTWKGTRPVVQLLDQVYRSGVRLTQAALRPFEQRLHRSATLPKWSAMIFPQPGLSGSR